MRVLVADDHPAIIEGLTTAFGRYEMEVVGQATRATEILERYEKCVPDVVVLDVRFGEAKTGLDIAREVLTKHPEARIVFYSQFDQDEILKEAYRVGGAGFVTKNESLDVLAEAIRQVSEGRTHFLPEIAERLALSAVRGDESPQTRLEPRELEVFGLMAGGRTNVEIAELIGLSPKTVSITSQNIKDKLGLHRPADITRLAIRHNVIEP